MSSGDVSQLLRDVTASYCAMRLQLSCIASREAMQLSRDVFNSSLDVSQLSRDESNWSHDVTHFLHNVVITNFETNSHYILVVRDLCLKNLGQDIFFISCISTDAPVVTAEHLEVLFINSQESCPNVSVQIQVAEIPDVAPLTYKLSVSSSDGCVLPECPMLVSPGVRILNMTLMNGVNYTAMLTVSNDCGSGSTTVPFSPGI